MRFSLLTVAVLLSSAPYSVLGGSTKTISKCITKLGPKSMSPVPTKGATLTLTFTARQTITSTPSTTITPSSTTETTTSTVLTTTTSTLTQVTDTFYETDTTTTTQSTTAVSSPPPITTTTTSTTTITTSTSTVPTVSGFTPAASSLPQQKKRSPKLRIEERSGSSVICKIGANHKPTLSPAYYPTAVICAGLVEVFTTKTSTKTATSTTTITAPTPTFTTTVFTTVVKTETFAPIDAETTITSTTTSTATFTFSSTLAPSTTTASTTVTVFAPDATVYAACSANNLVSSMNGREIDTFGQSITDGSNDASVNVNSATDCCVACQTTSGCAGFAFLDNSYNGCTLALTSNGVCNPSAKNIGFYNDGPAGTSYGFTVGSGPCGDTYYRGSG